MIVNFSIEKSIRAKYWDDRNENVKINKWIRKK